VDPLSSDIDFLRLSVESSATRISTAASGLLRDSMSHLESILDPQRFRRVHRSAIVNLDRVRELWTESPTVHWAVLGEGVRLPVSRRRWDELQAALLGLG
jgi:two-component system LytT family response regulator